MLGKRAQRSQGGLPTQNSIYFCQASASYSPFGKKSNGITMLKHPPWGLSIPNGVLSGLEKLDGPDPMVLVPRGFAVLNVDSSGSGGLDGTVSIMGTQEAEDGYGSLRPSPQA